MQGSERPPQGRGVERRGSTALDGRPVVTHWYGPVGRWLAHVATGVGHRVGAQPALAIVLLVGVIIAFTASFLVSRVYDAVVENDGVASLDRPMLQEAMQLRRPWLDDFSAGIAYVFGPVGMPLIAVAAILLLALTRKSWTPVILVAGAGVGSLLMTIAGKDIIGRSRPPLVDAVPPYEHSPSFPSGHSLNATVVAGVVGYLLWLHRHAILAKIACVVVPVVLAVVVGLTRVLLGAHWFTDVLAAWLLGAGWLAVVVTAHRLYLTARERGAPEAPQPRAAAQSHGPHRT